MSSLDSIFQQVIGLLEDNESLRNNDIALMVAYCRKNGISTDLADHIGDASNFTETIRRARQRAQMENPYLKATYSYRRRRKEEIEEWLKQ